MTRTDNRVDGMMASSRISTVTSSRISVMMMVMMIPTPTVALLPAYQKHYGAKALALTPHFHCHSSLFSSISNDETDTTDKSSSSFSSFLPPDFPRRHDALIAMKAAQAASLVANSLQPSTTQRNETSRIITKADTSPVTVADFTVQAMILNALHEQFPNDSFIAEESSQSLQTNTRVLEEIQRVSGLASAEQVCQSIDLGKQYEEWYQEGDDNDDNGNNEGKTKQQERPRRVWCLDPIDGTRGFLRGKEVGGQYCVALALLEDGKPTLGILACPNLPLKRNSGSHPHEMDQLNLAWEADETAETNRQTRGCLFVASEGGGCYEMPLFDWDADTDDDHDEADQEATTTGTAQRLFVTPNKPESESETTTTRTPAQGRFCIGVEKFSDALGQTQGTARLLQQQSATIKADNDDSSQNPDDDTNFEIRNTVRLDSQAKYGLLARGDGEYYLRTTKPGYVEWIWDHAAGAVVLSEAGGQLTDTNGVALDFSRGPQLSGNAAAAGIMGSNGGAFHEAVLLAFQEQEAARLLAAGE